MALDVEIPDPPQLLGPQRTGEYEAVARNEDDTSDDYRREAIVAFLEDGAWEDAFYEWAETTYLGEEEFRLVRELELFEDFDFFWDPAAEDVGYSAPRLTDARQRADLAGADVDGVNEELDELGRTVSEVLENDYVYRNGEEFGFFGEEYTGDEPTDEE